MSRIRTLLVIGTRPEAIKMAPVVRACLSVPDDIEPVVCYTGQHREMLSQVGDYFGLQPDVELNVMRPDQTLSGLTARCLEGIDQTIVRFQPDCLVAQGDTTTVLAAALTAFYRRLPLVHVEAGLRTGDLGSPWPEEFNRRLAGMTATLHCAPTHRAAANLLEEGAAPENVHVTGNTVIDALLWTIARERNRGPRWSEKYAMLADRRMVLITGHRRENFGDKLDSVCRAIVSLAAMFPRVEFLYPVHLNPRVREPVFRILGNSPNVHLTDPASYPEFVWLMDRAAVVITDSGGVQEEAPSLGKPVLVTRDTTERPEAVEAGAATLVGTDQQRVVDVTATLLTDESEYAQHQIEQNPYGDGNAAGRIVELISTRIGGVRRQWKRTA